MRVLRAVSRGVIVLILAFFHSDSGAAVVYRVDFEDGTTTASTGTSRREESAQGSTGGTITVQPNPKKDTRNSSNMVGRCRIPPGYRRAELSSQRLPTDGRTYLYRWSYYLPSDFYANATLSWTLISQWKTYPCGYHDGYKVQICPQCGIFNDLGAGTGSAPTFRFRWRAEPDCHSHTDPIVLGEWVDFQMEVRWTNSKDGYVVLSRNGTIIKELRNIKTLFDGFRTECNMYWAVGMYADWQGTKDFLDIYIDNIEIREIAAPTGSREPSSRRLTPEAGEICADCVMELFDIRGRRVRLPVPDITFSIVADRHQPVFLMRPLCGTYFPLPLRGEATHE